MSDVHVPSHVDPELRRCLEALDRGQTNVTAYDVAYTTDPNVSVGDQLTTNIAAIAELAGGMKPDEDHIITGLFSYDRGTLAPFGVVSGAAYVPNLDADKLDGYEGDEVAILAENEIVTGSYTFDANVTLSGTNKVIFNAATEYINSGAAGYMDYAAATAHRFNSTDLVVDSVGHQVGIGTATPLGRLHISDGNAPLAALITTDYEIITRQANAVGLSLVVASSGDPLHRGVVKCVRARGTLGTPIVPLTDDLVFSLLGSIWDGVETQGTAAVDMFVDGVVSAGVAPQRISFVTSETTALVRAERLVIGSDGTVTVIVALYSPLVYLPDGGVIGIEGNELITFNAAGNIAISGADLAMGGGAITGAGAITGTAITGTSFVIGANTLDTTEWAFLDGQDQALKVADSVEFAQVTHTGAGKAIFGGATEFIRQDGAGHLAFQAATDLTFYMGSNTVVYVDTGGTRNSLWFSKSFDAGFEVDQTKDQCFFYVGAGAGRQFVLGVSANADYDHAVQTNPTLYIQSATTPDTNNTQWLSLTHDQTDAVIATGLGNLDLNPAGEVRFNGTTKAEFNDTGTYWNSPSNGVLAGVTDGTLTLGAAATHQTIFDSSGRRSMIGDARVIHQEDVDLAIPRRPVANPPGEGNKDGFPTLDFDDTQDESIYLDLHLNHGYADAGAVRVHVDFFVDTAPGGAANVVWGAEYKKVSHGDIFDFTAGTSTVTVIEAITTGTPANDDKIHESSSISFVTTGWVRGDTLYIRLYRDANHGSDTFVGDVRMIGRIHLEWLADSDGEAI